MSAATEHDWRKGTPRKGETCMRYTDTTDRDNLVSCPNRADVAFTRRDDWNDGRGIRETRQTWCWEHRPDMVYVNTYSEYRAYGGPEEGGWYYSVGDPIGSIKAPGTTEARILADALWEGIDNIKKDRNLYDSENRLVVLVESHPPRHYPKVRPHYE